MTSAVPSVSPSFSPRTIYPANRGFSLVFLSVVLPFSSRFWLLAFCFWLFLLRGKDLCRQPFGIPVEHAY